MKVIGFNGSPRSSGSTAWAVENVLEGARARGAEVLSYGAGDLDVQPCRGCQGCVRGGGCVVHDDMRQIYDALKTADALVLGTPVYMGQMTAQAKTFTDRLYAQITPRFSPRFKEENAGKKLILVWTQGNPDAGKFRTYIDYTTQMFNTLEFEVRETLVIAGTRETAAKDQAGLAEKLRAAGAGLV